jgi:hypothetical protein
MANLEELRQLEHWLSPSEAGRVLGTTGQWVTHLARDGQVRGIKTSLGWLLHPDDIKAIADERKKKKQAERRRQQRQQRQQKQLQLA